MVPSPEQNKEYIENSGTFGCVLVAVGSNHHTMAAEIRDAFTGCPGEAEASLLRSGRGNREGFGTSSFTDFVDFITILQGPAVKHEQQSSGEQTVGGKVYGKCRNQFNKCELKMNQSKMTTKSVLIKPHGVQLFI